MFFFRVSTNSGLGHVMRCINISKELRLLKIKTFFFIDHCDKKLTNLIKKNTNSFLSINKNLSKKTEIEIIINKLKKFPTNYFIIDNYKCNLNFQKKISKFTKKLIIIDDNFDYKNFFCDVIINPNQTNNLNKYKKFLIKKTIIITGNKISLIRNNQILSRKKIKIIRKKFIGIKKILISFGGNSPLKYINLSLSSILEANIKNLKIYITTKKKIYNNFPIENNIKIVNVKNSFNLNRYYRICDICIGSCGHSTWERAANLLPSILIVLSQNQLVISKQINKTKSAYVTKSKNRNELKNFIKKKMLLFNRSNAKYLNMVHRLEKVIKKNSLSNLINKIIK